MGWLVVNPTARVERRKVQACAAAAPLNVAEVRHCLGGIERGGLVGLQDLRY